MKLLLVAATESELAPLLSHYPEKKDFSLMIGNHSVDILITSVGMVATAFALGGHLANNKYDLAVNAGIAGSFDFNLSLGEPVLVTEDIFSEQGAEDGEEFLKLDSLGFGNTHQFPYTNQIKSSFELPNLKKVKAITVNTVHGNELSISKVIALFKPQIESMEGAAFFYACNKTSTPCIQIRSISNYVERRNREKWNIPMAINSLNTALTKFIESV